MRSLKSIVACLALLIATPCAIADAIKCRDAAGKVIITDDACPGASRVERVQGAEYISPERRRQAMEVNAISSRQLNAIEAEKEAFGQKQAALQRAYAENDQREAQQRQIDDGRKKSDDECIALSKKGRRARHEAMAKGCAWGFEADRRITEEREMERSKPNPMITSCDSGGCWDTTGNRYNRSGKTFFRQDGKFCTRSGPSLSCN